MRRSKETKTKDTKNGNRAEYLCAISWLAMSPNDRLEKSSEKDDIEKHIDWIVTMPDNKKITYDAKARRFENYGDAFSENHYFIAEIENRGIKNGRVNTGSIYGKQDYMVHEISGNFVFIRRKLIVNEVENDVKKTGYKVTNINSAYRNLYTSPKYDDGHVLTVFPFSEFEVKLLPIPEEFRDRQFNYTEEELKAYIRQHNLNIKYD